MSNLPSSGQPGSMDALTVTREEFRQEMNRLLEYLAQALGGIPDAYDTQTVSPGKVVLQGEPKLLAAAAPPADDDSLRLPSTAWVKAALAAAAGGAINVDSVNGGQLAGIRNRLINGNFLIDQRMLGAAGNLPPATPTLMIDRWYGWAVGGTATFQRTFNPAGGLDSSLMEVRGAANVSAVNIAQRIERTNCLQLKDEKVTLSASLSCSLLTSATWQIYRANTADVFGSIAAPTKTLVASGTWTISPTMDRYSAVIDIPDAETTGLEVVIGVGALTSGTFRISRVQLELGEKATPYEWLDFGAQLLQCCRYFHRLTAAAVYNLTAETRNISATTTYPVPMRVVPTITGAPANINNVANFTSLHNVAGASWGGNMLYTAEAEL